MIFLMMSTVSPMGSPIEAFAFYGISHGLDAI